MADENLPPRVAVLEEIARTTRDGLSHIEARFDRLDERLDTKFDAIAKRQSDDLKFLFRLHITHIVLMFAGFAALLGVIARAQHWI
jgi:hypothetical protein